MRYFDAAIIGGGPAGSFTAMLLASAGFRVSLFEKKIFPRETLCGEFLSYEVWNHLRNAGLSDKFLSLNPNKITSFGLFAAGGRKIETSLKFTAFGLKRSSMDMLLLEEARIRGASVYQPAEASIVPGIHNGFIIKTNSTGEPVRSEILIAAYGKKNPLDRELNRTFREESTPFNGVKIHLHESHFRNLNKQVIHIYTGKNIYCGINAVNDNDVTLCFLEKRVKGDPPVKEKLLLLRKQNKYFDEILCRSADEAVMDAKVYGTGNIYFGRKGTSVKDIFMAGDAAGIIAPVAGDGIGMAMESAVLISRLLINEKNVNDARSRYNTEWNRKFRRRIFTAAFIQRVMFSSVLNPGMKLLELYPRLINTLIDYTRK